MFFLMSLLFYWALDSKTMSTWRNVAFIVCTLVGGIGSEFLQHAISNFRKFDPLDIVANVLGSALAIGLSNVYHNYQVKRTRYRKINRSIMDIEAQLDRELEDLAPPEEITIPLTTSQPTAAMIKEIEDKEK